MHAATIDLTPITNVLLQLAATVLLGLGSWGATRLVSWLGLKNSAQATANLDDALQKSVTYGLQQSQAMIAAKGWDHVDVHNAALASALPYMIQRFPDALKAAGVDMSNQQALQATVAGALDRSFPQAVAVAAASPATPLAGAPGASHAPARPGATTSLAA